MDKKIISFIVIFLLGYITEFTVQYTTNSGRGESVAKNLDQARMKNARLKRKIKSLKLQLSSDRDDKCSR